MRIKTNRFSSNRQGAQGILDGASNAQLDSEFGTHKEEDVVKAILEKGDVQETKSSSKEADRVSIRLDDHQSEENWLTCDA